MRSQLSSKTSKSRIRGFYEVEIVGRIDSKDLPGGVRNMIGRAGLVERTTVVPAQPCVSFGFEYQILGTPAGAEVSLRMVTRFPDEGVRDPQRGIVLHKSEALVPRTIGRQHYRAFTFEEPWEIVPGVWKFEIWHHHRKLAERSFSVARDFRPHGDSSACAAPSVWLGSPPASRRIAAVFEEATAAVRP